MTPTVADTATPMMAPVLWLNLSIFIFIFLKKRIYMGKRRVVVVVVGGTYLLPATGSLVLRTLLSSTVLTTVVCPPGRVKVYTLVAVMVDVCW